MEAVRRLKPGDGVHFIDGNQDSNPPYISLILLHVLGTKRNRGAIVEVKTPTDNRRLTLRHGEPLEALVDGCRVAVSDTPSSGSSVNLYLRYDGSYHRVYSTSGDHP